MGSALLDTDLLDPAFAVASSDSPTAAAHAAARAAASPASTEALRRQVTDRLAAHRSRRAPAQPALALALSTAPSPSAPSRASRIAAAVAQRYAHSPSYRAVLAAEAKRATQQAQAAAQIAALNAQAVAAAQQQLLDSLDQDSLDQDSHNQEAHNQALLNQPQNDHPAQIESSAQLPREQTLWPEAQPEPATAPATRTRSADSSRPAATHPHAHPAHCNAQPFAPALSGLTVRIFEDAAATPLRDAAHLPLAASRDSHRNRQQEDRNDAEARALDEEIAFRQSPVFEEPAGPPMPLPANLIEFPRQLVAPRKARPRYAEGPLRAAVGPAPGAGQLRIFEVDPAQISTTPAPAEAPVPQWNSIWLDAPNPDPTESAPTSSLLSSRSDDYLSSRSEAEGSAFPSARTAPLPQIASIARRLTAAAIDASILLAGFMAFAAAFLLAAFRSIPWQAAASLPLDRHPGLARLAAQFAGRTGLQPSLALAASVLVLALLVLLYQALFFSFSESTPGMRCARIALCTFDDENPTRRAMRRRILAVLVSFCPLGLGLLWAAFDEDRLAWHDRLTRTYQRTY